MVHLRRSDRERHDAGSAAEVLAISAVWSRGLLIAAILAAAVLASIPHHLAATVGFSIAAAGFLAGVPHGAVDHLLATRLIGDRPLMMVIGVYAALAVGTWALLQWAGPVALLAVVALSAVHFGLGELEVNRLLTGWRPGWPVASAIVLAGCGALLLPLARSGEQLQTVATAVSPDLARIIGAAPVQFGLGLAWLLAAVVAVVAALGAGHRTVAADVVLIGLLGLLAPPLVAFAVWFGAWHAVRHTARVMTVEPGCTLLLTRGCRRQAMLRLVRLAALPTAAALIVVAVLVWLTATAVDPAVMVAEALRVLLALTVPHMVVVFWLDRAARQDATT